MIKRLIVMPTVVLGMLLSAGVALAQVETADAHLEQIGNSGIDAQVNFIDSGSTLTIDGKGNGFKSGQTYFSLLYDVESEDSGPNACEPGIRPGQPGSLTNAQMWAGFWLPVSSSTRTLHILKTATGSQPPAPTGLGVDLSGPSYVPVSSIGTMSVRLAPFPLQACGSL